MIELSCVVVLRCCWPFGALQRERESEKGWIQGLREESYVEFLRIRRVPLQERICADEASDVVPQVCSRPFIILFFLFCHNICIDTIERSFACWLMVSDTH